MAQTGKIYSSYISNILNNLQGEVSFTVEDDTAPIFDTLFSQNAFSSIPEGSTISKIEIKFQSKINRTENRYKAQWSIYDVGYPLDWDGNYTGYTNLPKYQSTWTSSSKMNLLTNTYQPFTCTINNPSLDAIRTGLMVRTRVTYEDTQFFGTNSSIVYIKDFHVIAYYTPPTYYLDLNGTLDGSSSGGISPYGTADVYINGSLTAQGVSDYYTAHPVGTTYEIKNIKVNEGYKYNGNASYSGTLTAATSVVLSFSTKTPCTITYDGNGATSGSVAAQSGYIGDSLTLRDNGFVKTSATFLGWYTAASGGSQVTSPYTPTSASVTLYAHWKTNSTNMIYIGTKQPTFYIGTRQVQSIYLGMTLIYEIVTIVDSGTCGSNLTYTLDSHGVLTISGTGDMQDSSFGWDTSLIKSVVINDGVTSIGNGAFNGCSSLTNITIPDGVTRIGNNAFSNCTGLTSVTIPDSVKSIGWGAFRGCASLTSITIPDSVTSIGEGAFHGCTGLTSITIPDSVTSIGDNPFRGCTGLIKITVSSGNTVYHSTDNCLIATKTKTLISGFKNSIIPSDGSVTSIGWGAFWGYSALTSIIIPDSVTSIGGYAFYSCTGLTSVTIPDSVTSIGENAFIYCTGLTEIDFSACTDIPALGSSDAFSNTSSSLVIKVPSALLDEWKAATNWSTYADKMVGV